MAYENNMNSNVAAYGQWNTDYSTNNGANWGAGAVRSSENVFGNLGRSADGRNFLQSRLWHGVPQLTDEQMTRFEAAYTGHTFIFVVNAPAFMTTGMYRNTEMHQLMKNLKAIMERASTGFSGFSPITAQNADQDDGHGRKISHITAVTKDQSNVSFRLHEFAGLPVKNAIEAWLTGIYDIRSQHGNYHGNLGIKDGWCLKNHTMSVLVVQVTPDWTTIQDAAYYYNMVPVEVPFQHFEWTKGESTIVEDYDIEFFANEERSPAIMLAAEKYMNNRILSMVGTSVYNSRQFVVHDFGNQASEGFKQNIGDTSTIIDKKQYNQYITSSGVATGHSDTEDTTAVKSYGVDESNIEYSQVDPFTSTVDNYKTDTDGVSAN